MRKKVLSMLALTILVALTLVGCGGGGSPCPSTLTILSITEGDVSVMKAGTDNWTEAQVEMELEVGETIKAGDDSGAEITFFDGSTMELEAGTEIEIISLDLSCDTGVTTITLMQTIGTTISRVTKLLDPASSYEVETPTGVAGVRGSILIVTVAFGDVNYEDGTTWIANQEGNIYAIAQGVIIVASAGNEGEAGMGYPGAYEPVISVAASGWVGEWIAPRWPFLPDVPEGTDPADYYITDFSSRALSGQDLDVAAPGSWIVGPYQVNQGQLSYYYLGGTSMASPHVAGIVALMAQKNPSLTPGAAESILQTAAIPFEGGLMERSIVSPYGAKTVTFGDDATGSGLITADGALDGVVLP